MLQIIGLGQCCAYDVEFSMTVVKAVVVAYLKQGVKLSECSGWTLSVHSVLFEPSFENYSCFLRQVAQHSKEFLFHAAPLVELISSPMSWNTTTFQKSLAKHCLSAAFDWNMNHKDI
jgi:hypothetical protein